MAIALAILLKNSRGGFDLIYMKDFSNERQVEIDVELDEGEYLILPRCSGCTLRRPPNARNQNIKLLNRDGNLHYLAELAIKDIFRRLDKVVINNVLEF